MLSVFLVDDEVLIRDGLKKLISWEHHGFTVIGEAGDGEEALELLRHTHADIIITDLKMPFMGGLELIEKLSDRLPDLKVIVLTGYDDFHLLQQSIRNGVTDYLLKPVGREELTQSLAALKKRMGEHQFQYPFEIESTIQESIAQNKRVLLGNATEMLFEVFIRNQVSFEIVCHSLHQLLVSISRVMDSEGLSLNEICEDAISKRDYFLQFGSTAHTRTAVNQIFNKIMDIKNGDSRTHMIYKIKSYIEKNYNENITLEMLAGKFYINPSYLSQLFKSETHQNYNDYLSGIRVEKAKKFLMESNLSIEKISEMVGYSNSKYFSQLFRKYTGKQPSQFRKNPTVS